MGVLYNFKCLSVTDTYTESLQVQDDSLYTHNLCSMCGCCGCVGVGVMSVCVCVCVCVCVGVCACVYVCVCDLCEMM